jgi:membrane-associated phospholipid phosphatase
MKITAQIISIIAHPLLMLTYMLLLLLLVNPYLFGVNSISDLESKKLILSVFFTSFLLPAIGIFLMLKLEFISSMEMRDKKDRIGPFIVTVIFYMWVFQNVLKNNDMPTAFLIAVLGTTIGLCLSFFINLFFKISLHATGIGGYIGMVLIIFWYYSYGVFDMWLPFIGSCSVSINLVLIVSMFMAGLIGTSRLGLGAHTSRELYAGFALGLLCQYMALKILL